MREVPLPNHPTANKALLSNPTDGPASQQAPAPAGPLGGASSSSSWSGSWIDKWFFPEEGSSSDPNQEEPLATNQPTEVMGPEAPSPSWLKEKIDSPNLLYYKRAENLLHCSKETL